MEVEQALVQKIFSTVEEAYLVDIHNQTTNLINNIMANVLTHLKYNCEQLMTHKLLMCKEIFNKKSYHLHEPIAPIFSVIKELLEFSDITGTS